MPVIVLLTCLIAGSAAAQQLVWEGEVDGTAVLYVRGNRVDIEDKQGLPVQRQRFRFSERLPDSRQEVRVEVLEGRGRVHVVEQPRLENNYTLAVAIEDRQSGRAFYSLAFHWQSGGGFFGGGSRFPSGRSSFGGGDGLTWSGRVDDEAIIECRQNQCAPQATRGGPVTRDRYQFSRPLPNRSVRVSLEDANGRGEIRLIEQPSESNGYAARVLIRDSQGGAGDYGFALTWTRPSRNEPENLYARRGLIWAGRVDGHVRVIVQATSAFTELVSGTPVMAERANFDRPLPTRGAPNAAVKKLRGRGRVELVEFPSERNGHRLVFEIEDRDGGADNYEVEVGW